ncbi:zinc finger protein, putative, partial [Ichthyophthirius multifiliis]
MEINQQDIKDTQQIVELKVVQWNKDSHGLFDYESKSVDLKQIKINQTCQIYQLKNSQFLTQIQIEKINEKIYSYTLNPFYEDTYNKMHSNNKLEQFLIVRSLKNQQNQQKGYSLQIDDVVKFGRIEYQVIQMRTEESNIIQNQTPYEQLDLISIKNSNENPIVCKICLSEDSTPDNFFTNICQCKGSCEYAHFQCLKLWIQSNQKYKSNNSMIYIQWKKNRCELCGTEYPKFLRHNNQMYSLINFDIPDCIPYIILDSIGNHNKISKNIFIIQVLNPEIEIKIGRGNQCLLRIADISVSRIHSSIKYKDKQFIISDNNSKFGTLIRLKSSLQISNEKKQFKLEELLLHLLLRK